ncbi:hypothetical protein BDZ97DRAFT_1751754 [Flammula alnicola]|nr:hypothetical protein BDZ97DRAFT_1751754 [Flammula alnicola]
MSGEIAPQERILEPIPTHGRAHAKFGQNVGPAQAGSRMINFACLLKTPQDCKIMKTFKTMRLSSKKRRLLRRQIDGCQMQEFKTKLTLATVLVEVSVLYSPCWGGLSDFRTPPERRQDQVLQIPNHLRFFPIFDHQVREKLDVVVKEGSVQDAKRFEFSQTMGWPKTRSCRGNGWPPVQFRRGQYAALRTLELLTVLQLQNIICEISRKFMPNSTVEHS